MNLVLARVIAERHGGTLTVDAGQDTDAAGQDTDAADGESTTLVVRLPSAGSPRPGAPTP